jgi:hypothetical protein
MIFVADDLRVVSQSNSSVAPMLEFEAEESECDEKATTVVSDDVIAPSGFVGFSETTAGRWAGI